MPNFINRPLTITDAGDGDSINVFDPQSGNMTPISMSRIKAFMDRQLDPNEHYAFNFAACLDMSGFTNIQNPDGSANADALTLLNSVSFKGYP